MDAGGTVTAAATEIAGASGSTSSITISGAGSTYNATTPSRSDCSDAGTLNLLNDGLLTIGGGATPLIVGELRGRQRHAEYRQRRRRGPCSMRARCSLATGRASVNFNHSGSIDFAMPITGVGGVSKFGSGTTNLTGVSTFTRALTVTGGRWDSASAGRSTTPSTPRLPAGGAHHGPGSQWTNTATTYVGDTGVGTATVQDGGLLRANTALLLSRFGTGNGTLTSPAPGPRAVTNGELRIADQGTGLAGNSGRRRGHQRQRVAGERHRRGSRHGACERDEFALWSITGFLDVAERGTGTLLVENGGRVQNTGGGFVGFIGGSNGFATVDGRELELGQPDFSRWAAAAWRS